VTLRPPASDAVLVPRLVTIVVAAQLLGVGRSTLHELIAPGEVHIVHIGRSARIPTQDIDAYVERLRERATPVGRRRVRRRTG